MSKKRLTILPVVVIAALFGIDPGVRAQSSGQSKKQARKTQVQAAREQLNQATGAAPTVTETAVTNAAALLAPAPPGFQDYSIPNYANSPLLAKFVDALPGLCAPGSDSPGNCISIAVPKAPPLGVPNDGDYYEIGLQDYSQKMHRDLNSTHLRGYYDMNGSHPPSYLGPIIVAQRDRPVRIKFTNNLLPDGKHILPVDTTVMGAGPWEKGDVLTGQTTVGNFGENRASVHLHGGFTPWISDGTPHQWISPGGETSDYEVGASTNGVPDMDIGLGLGNIGNGLMSLYYPNQQTNRLMFYHDHAYGITRLNVYAGEAAGYLIHDAVEDALISTGTLPNMTFPYTWGVPLIIQDKSFVWGDKLAGTGTYATDPLWATAAPNSVSGDLWFPHVYVPNQDPYGWFCGPGTSQPVCDPTGMNPMGRWDYGAWVWPPATVQVPDTMPHPSIVPEAFMDTMVVNGKAFPYFNVGRRAYRFRILNASNDRFLNLQLYYAWDVASQRLCDGTNSGASSNAACTEVKMVPADGATYKNVGPSKVSYTVESDGRAGGVPDPRATGPIVVQIGSEGGFLPMPVTLNNPAVPIGYDRDPKSMTVGNVKNKNLLLGPAERADIIIDFSQVPASRNARLILYNDAPAALPAGDPRYDYYYYEPVGAIPPPPDVVPNGGAAPTELGKGPNTRTIMQFVVSGGAAAPFNFAALDSAIPTAYGATQDPPLVPELAYNGPFPGIATKDNYATIFDKDTFTFQTSSGPVTLPIHNKAIAEEFDVAYGRMSALLGTEAQITNNQGQNTFGFAYVDPATENLPAGVTQIWKITHNGVDTHAIHWHLINVQVINRVDWAGVIKPPDPNELGWKETLRMNPLEDILVAVQARPPALPFLVPDSIRPKDVTMGINSQLGFTQPWPYEPDDPTLQPAEFQALAANPAPTVNELTNFGWEYVWHCHLLGHEENDMMRPLVMTNVAGTGQDVIPPTVTAAVSPVANAAGWNNSDVTVTLAAADNATGSGVASISFSYDGGTFTDVSGASAVLPLITSEGPTNIWYYATDLAVPSNVSATQKITVQLDKTAPLWLAAPTASAVVNGRTSVTVAGQVDDALSFPLTGTAAGTYVMTGPSPSAGTFSIAANGSFSFSRTKLKNGSYSVTVTVKDIAGNPLSSTMNFPLP